MAKISELDEIYQVEDNNQSYVLISDYDSGRSEPVSKKISINSIVSDIRDNYNMAFVEDGTLYQSGISVGKDIMQIPYLVYYSESGSNLFYYDENGSSNIIDLNQNPSA